MEQNDIDFNTVAICGGYISKYPRLLFLPTKLLFCKEVPRYNFTPGICHNEVPGYIAFHVIKAI